MSVNGMKEEILVWHDAVIAANNGELEMALNAFQTMADTSKIHFNIARIFFNQGYFQDAVDALMNAVELDLYLAVAYFDMGNAHAAMGDYNKASVDYQDTILYLRGNACITYNQLGMDYSLHTKDVYYNLGICFLKLGNVQAGVKSMEASLRLCGEKDKLRVQTAIENCLCNEFIEHELSLVQLPTNVYFRPSDAKVRAATQKLSQQGKSKVIATIDQTDTFIGFKGAHMRKAMQKLSDKGKYLSQLFTESSNDNAMIAKLKREENDFHTSEEMVGMLKRKPSRRYEAEEQNPRHGRSYSENLTTPHRHERSFSDTSNIKTNSLKIKCHHKDTRLIRVTYQVTFAHLKQKVEEKFNRDISTMKYRDDEQDMVLVTDDEDLEMALAVLNGRLEIWIE